MLQMSAGVERQQHYTGQEDTQSQRTENNFGTTDGFLAFISVMERFYCLTSTPTLALTLQPYTRRIHDPEHSNPV